MKRRGHFLLTRRPAWILSGAGGAWLAFSSRQAAELFCKRRRYNYDLKIGNKSERVINERI